MTIIARDRPGIVELISRVVSDHGGNWLESRMAHLGGQFAGILSISIPPDSRPALEQTLAGLREKGITVTTQADDAEPAPAEGLSAELRLVGNDRPGIVRQIARALAEAGVNVEELSTECVSAPMSGEPLFQAEARVKLPAGCAPGDLSAALEKIANDLMVDLTFQPLPENK